MSLGEVWIAPSLAPAFPRVKPGVGASVGPRWLPG